MHKLLPIALLSAALATPAMAATVQQKPTQQVPVPMPNAAGATADAAKPQEPAAPAKLDPAVYDHFGDGIAQGTPAVALAEALKAPEKFTGKPVRLEGPVTAVCQTKGCWMLLGDAEPTFMVKFKDYGFFMPKDASGRTAIVDGTMTMEQETVEQTRHYLEDAGKHDEAKKVTEGRKVFKFVANGVALKKAVLDTKLYDHFGDGIAQGTPAVPLAEALKAPEKFTGKPVRLTGVVTEVCQTKGCWMVLGDAEPTVRVKFKDYGFFMPKDASGRTAIVDGTMTMEQETVEVTRHYLEDAGKHDEAKKVTEGRKVFKFVANGVALRKATGETEKQPKAQ